MSQSQSKSQLVGKFQPELHPPSLSINAIHAQLGFLQGKVLTVIDAALSGPQNKAVKDLIKAAFVEQRDHINSLVFEPWKRVDQSPAPGEQLSKA